MLDRLELSVSVSVASKVLVPIQLFRLIGRHTLSTPRKPPPRKSLFEFTNSTGLSMYDMRDKVILFMHMHSILFSGEQIRILENTYETIIWEKPT